MKIILADDHRIVRDGLRSLLEKEPGMVVVAEADNGREAVRLARELEPDVVIMDVSMPDLNGMEATRHIVKDVPGARVIALSMHSDKRFVSGMLAAGASGYLLKDSAFEELVRAVRTVAGGRMYVSPAITSTVVEDYVGRLSQGGPAARPALTPREREVLQLLAEGKSTREIARSLNVSTKTVETHRRQTMEKPDIHSVAELTKYALREGLTSLEP